MNRSLNQNWQENTFGGCIDLISGQHIMAADVNEMGKGYPYLTGPADFSNGYIQQTKFVEKPKVMCRKGDLLLTVKGSGVGSMAVADDHYCISRQLMALRAHDINADFLSYIVPNVMKDLIHRAAIGMIPGISRNDILKLKLLVPPLPEQQKIAAILKAWDEAIGLSEQLIEKKKKFKQGVIHLLLTRKKKLSGFSDEWGLIKLKDVLEEKKERNKNGLIERVLSVTNYNGFMLAEQQFSKRVASSDVRNYKIVRSGQFGYNPSRLNVGSFGRLDKWDVGLLSPMYVVFSVTEKRLNSDYFLMWMGSIEAIKKFQSKTQGTVRDAIAFDALCGFLFKLPKIEEQQAIVKVLFQIDKEIKILKKQLSNFKMQKCGLMQQLLIGRIKVQ